MDATVHSQQITSPPSGAPWQTTIDNFWDLYFKFNSNLGEAAEAEERDQINQVVQLLQQGQIDEATIKCGRSWQRENERKDPSSKFAHGGCDNHPVIWILSRIYGSVKYPDLWQVCGNYCMNPAFLLMQGMARDIPNSNHGLLETYCTVAVYWLRVQNNLMLSEAVKFGTRLLAELDRTPNFENGLRISLRNSLANVFLRGYRERNGNPGIDSDPQWNVIWAQKQAIIQAFMNDRDTSGDSPLDGEALRLTYSFIDVSCSQGLEEHEAVSSLLRLYQEREIVYGEKHDSSMSFIEDLLVELVRLKGTPRVSLTTGQEHGFMLDLIDFCLQNERYDEAQTLVEEFTAVPGSIISTDSSTEREVFSKWRSPTKSVQALLAKNEVPKRHHYWEDSRLYSMRVKSVDVRQAEVADPFPKSPVLVRATLERGLELEISERAQTDWKGQSGTEAVRDITHQVHGSEIWHLLQRLHAENDWSILLGLDLQSHHRKCIKLNHFSNDAQPHEEVCKTDMYGDSHEIWIFPEELVEAAVGENQRATEPFGHVYRFLNTGKFESPCWVVLKFPQPEDKDENQPTTCAHGTHYRNKQSFCHKSGIQYNRDDEASKMACSILEESNSLERDGRQQMITLKVPIIAYDSFQLSLSYRSGMTYSEYVDMLRGYTLGGPEFSDGTTLMRKAMESNHAQSESHSWEMTRLKEGSENSKAEDAELKFTRGFFNGIPSGGALLDTTAASQVYGYVSTAWRDWKSYTLHPAPVAVLSKLGLSPADSLLVLGYIMGTWTEQDLSRQAAGLRLLVIDANLTVQGKRVNFVMNSCFYPGNSKSLSGYERRNMCGRLNYTLFRYAPPRFDNLVGRVESSKRLKRKREPDFKFLEDPTVARHESHGPETMTAATVPYSSDEFWDEMMAREVWDRMVEKRLGLKVPAHCPWEYERWRDGEEQRRRDWDESRDVDKVAFTKKQDAAL